jgi:hypothetical protein
VAFDGGINLVDGGKEAREVDLTMVLQRDFREDGERAPSLATSICAE